MLSDWDLAVRLLLSAGLGSLIGAERERLAWTVGLRAHMLVGAAYNPICLCAVWGWADEIRITLTRILPPAAAEILARLSAVPGVREIT